jgi:tetratricopeptide (TPR) repeat protein
MGRLKRRSGKPESARRLPGNLPGARGRSRWGFRLLALTLVPLVCLGGLEGILRLAGYGYSTGFFKPMRIGQQEFLIENDQVGLRFFPPELLRSPPPLRMQTEKPPGTFRIFVFGESAAMGDPEPAFGPSRYFEALLRERYPAQQFEVVNVAMTAINSHVILPIARDCARQRGDLWLIYMGNNEMVGPFGAATVFGAQTPPLALIRLSLSVQKTRIGQLAIATVRRLKSRGSPARAWGGMQMFAENHVPPSDPRRARVYQNFQSNLRGILQAGLSSGASVVLSTVAVNLKDCPPFASGSSTNLPPAEYARFAQLLADAKASEGQGRLVEAIEAYGRAAAIDPHSAEVQFHWGDCLLRHGQADAARPHLESASLFDALPFRADSRINELIALEAGRVANRSLVLCDAARILATNNPAGVPGQESFYEHVHLNFDGSYRLARAWASAIEPLLPASRLARAEPGWPSQERCERRLGLTDWNRCNVIAEVLRRLGQPPLSSQFNNDTRIRALVASQAALQQHLDAAAASSAREVYVKATARSPKDFRLHENFADFLQATGNYPAAAAEWQSVRELIPQDHIPAYELGRLAEHEGHFDEAASWLSRSLKIRPDFAAAWLELGKTHAAQGKFAEALAHYGRARSFEPQDAQAWYFAGLALSKSDRRTEAIDYYRRATELNPGFWEAHFELGGQLGLDGKIDQAREQLEQAVRLKPEFAVAHLNLGIALMKQGHLDKAQEQFERTLQLDPGNVLAPTCLAHLSALRKGRN